MEFADVPNLNEHCFSTLRRRENMGMINNNEDKNHFKLTYRILEAFRRRCVARNPTTSGRKVFLSK